MRKDRFPAIHPDDIVWYVTNDMYGGEWTEESCARFNTFKRLWQEWGPFRVIISGGLKNARGESIAEHIYKTMLEIGVPEKFIIRPFDEESSDTYTQVVKVLWIYRDNCNVYQSPKLYAVSDKLHLAAINRIAKQYHYTVNKIISPMSGGLLFRIRRTLTEIVRWVIGIYDRRYESAEGRRQKIIAKAATKLPHKL